MARLEELSRDELRSQVSSLRIMRYAEVRRLNKNQLINVITENRNRLNNNVQNPININENNINNAQELKDILPFENSIFNEYRKFKTVKKQTIYENRSHRQFKKLDVFLNKIKWQVLSDIEEKNVKISFHLEIELLHPVTNEKIQYRILTSKKELLIEDDREKFYLEECKEMEEKTDKMALKGIKSGYTFLRPIHLIMTQNIFRQFRGASYIDLPKWIKDKKAIRNIKNRDNRCFMWTILAALHPAERDAERVSKYRQYENELNFNRINFPIKISDIPKIEKTNNLAVNVYSHQGKSIIPIYNSKQLDIPEERIIDMFLIREENNGEINSHYCWINNFNRFFNNEISRDNHKYICRRCLAHFHVKIKYERHIEECSKNKPVKFIEPKEDYVYFKNTQRAQKVPYAIYADFESLIEKYISTSNNPNKSWTEKCGKHTASAFCAIVIDFNGKIIDIEVYRGYNADIKFNEYIIKMCDYLINLEDKVMKKLTCEQWILFDKSIICPDCKQSYTDLNYKVRDHDHFSGEFRGPLCNQCNLAKKKGRFIPVFFHNLKGYDSHLILSSINNEVIQHSDISVIPNNSEKYISFSYKKLRNPESKLTYEIRFLDTFSFMQSSLDSLSKNLNDDQLKISKQFFKNNNQFKLMRRKGIYPYEYMNSFKKYEETKLPSQEMFRDELNDKDCSTEDYLYAKLVYKKMECKNLGDFTDIYMINDVLLLADVFETFRETCMNHYDLDPCWYYTAPGLAWDAMLKVTNIKLQTIKDYDMYLFIEKGIRGGMVNSIKRYSKANNKYMKNYDPKKISKYLIYLDANNLYGWAMIQKLLYDALAFEEQFDENWNFSELKEYIEKLNEIGKGCILEVHLEYP